MSKKTIDDFKYFNEKIKIGFNKDTITLPLSQIIPVKIVTKAIFDSQKYKQILSSIKEIGIIEPPIVTVDMKSSERYILLDGHLRLEALKNLKIKEVTCLISTDDEAFTYNKHINRLSAIQEHKMILKAVERGVPEARLAQALNVNITNIQKKRNLLNGICEEAVELLKDKMISMNLFPILKQMRPMRQIEVATLMNDAMTYTLSYGNALLAATSKDDLIESKVPKKVKDLSEEQMARMENEMSSVQHEYVLIEENYGVDVLNLTLARGYIGSLLNNAKIVNYLAQHHTNILSEFQKIVRASNLN